MSKKLKQSSLPTRTAQTNLIQYVKPKDKISLVSDGDMSLEDSKKKGEA